MENFIPIPALYGATIERERLLANMIFENRTSTVYDSPGTIVIDSPSGARLFTGCVLVGIEDSSNTFSRESTASLITTYYYTREVKPEAPSIKQSPKLRVGDAVTWEFYVDGYAEQSVSVVVKLLNARSVMLRDGFIVEDLEIYKAHPYTKVGRAVVVKRADVVNGGYMTVYSNDCRRRV